jgi:enoyl-CoA hydratase/carnithine racemase
VAAPLIHDEDGARWITLDRPEILNALTLDDLRAIREALADLEGVRAIVFAGSGQRAFSAGMHVDTFGETPPDGGRDTIEQVGACLRAVRLAPVPTVAMIDGWCLGAAFELALACDVRVATPESRFGLPEVKLGIPSVVDAALLLHHVGLSKAKELILTGQPYAADELPPGLVNRTAPRERLREKTCELLGLLTAPTREVIAAQKALFETWLNVGLAESIERSKDVFADVLAQPATIDAIARYRKRR